jgi:hypothetical protein
MPTVEKLCSHHYIGAFRCTRAPQYEITLARLYSDADLGVYPRTYVTVTPVVVDGVIRGEVSGFISVSDAEIDLAGTKQRFFWFAHLAVSDHLEDTTQMLILVRRAQLVLSALQEIGKHYEGFAATPGNNQELIRLLRALGFVEAIDGYWIRRFSKR